MPDFHLIGGPNGAGKTTIALHLLPYLGCHEFVNADLIASSLAPFRPEGAALQAGVLMMKRLRELTARGVSFGTESTLAARAWVPFIRECREAGYRFTLHYIWLPGADIAISRVASRVRAGGHSIPEEVIRRRYEAGRLNFLDLYAPMADYWAVLDNSGARANTVATGGLDVATAILQSEVWSQMLR